MSQDLPNSSYLPSFHRLLRRLRDATPISVIAERGNMDEAMLRNIEAGRRPVDVELARQILVEGFTLDALDTERLIVGLRLYDLGLRDNAIRALVADVILKTAPDKVSSQLRQLYRSYTSIE